MNPEYEPFDERLQKPKPGAGRIAALERDRDIKRKEEAEKAKARKRDVTCRLPFCPHCAEYGQRLRKDVAHVIAAKGMGGDPSGIRSLAHLLMVLCELAHPEQERHEWIVEPLTDLGTFGPCAFFLAVDVYNPETRLFTTELVLWAQETAIRVYTSDRPLTTYPPVRRIVGVD